MARKNKPERRISCVMSREEEDQLRRKILVASIISATISIVAMVISVLSFIEKM